MTTLNDKQIEALKTEWAVIKTVDPVSATYKKLESFISSLSDQALEQLAFAQVNFVSYMAKRAFNSRGLY